MATLLDSRAHHHRVRVLSRKLRESNVHDEEPPNRRFPSISYSPVTNKENEVLTPRQRSQRQCRQREKASESFQDAHNAEIVDVEPTGEQVHIVRSHSLASDLSTGRQRGQTLRWQRVRNAQSVSGTYCTATGVLNALSDASHRTRTIQRSSTSP